MLLSKTKKKKKNQHYYYLQQQNKKNNNIKAPVLQYRWKCYHEVALNYQQVGPTFLCATITRLTL